MYAIRSYYEISILDPGGTSFLVGEQVDKLRFMDENHKVLAEGLKPAVAEPLVLGITQASLTTDSRITSYNVCYTKLLRKVRFHSTAMIL